MPSSRDGKDGHETQPATERDQAAPTIVGGRPLKNRAPSTGFPLGIEVLLKKASVDREFRKALLKKRSVAASEIGLNLSPSEAATLDNVPQSHIEKIIDRTSVPDEHRRVFLGKVAAAMLALLGIPLSAASEGKRLDVAWEFNLGGCTVYDMKEMIRRSETIRRLERARLGRLRVNAGNTDDDSVTVRVAYYCPFDKGEVKIYFRRDDNSEGAATTVEPRKISVSKGVGKVTFFVEGKDGETQWLLVAIRSTTADCVDAPWEFVDWRDHRETNHEYNSHGCALCRVIPFEKKWA